jgi:hypothetical protein
MSTKECQAIQDVLPDLAQGTLEAELEERVLAHLSACAECRHEEGIVRAILAARPEPPVGLQERIQERVREGLALDGAGSTTGTDGVVSIGSRRRWVPTWALSAAAVLVLSLGIGVVWDGRNPPDLTQDPVQVVSEEPLPESWLWDDGLVAGGPVYDGLTDEQLVALIEELEG